VLAQFVSAEFWEGGAADRGLRFAGGGNFWLSGILNSQQEEVVSAYRGQGLKLIRAVRRGNGFMLAFG